MNKYNICAVIITYNPDKVTLQNQIDSLLNQVDSIIYIDNCSINIAEIKKIIKETKEKYTSLYFVCNKANMGLGYAHNQGIKIARENKSTHVLILDHDSVLDSNFIFNLIETEKKLLDNNFKVGSIGPIYRNDKTGEIYPITRYIGPFIKRIHNINEPIEASFLISSGSLIPLSVIDEVGLMDEGLFVDYVDVEWSYRARSFGYQLYVSPKAKMNHEIGDKRVSIFGRKISVHSPLRRYYLCRNSIQMIRNPNIPIGYKIREIVFNFLRISVFFLLSKKRIMYLKYSFIGYWDGLKKIQGPCSINL